MGILRSVLRHNKIAFKLKEASQRMALTENIRQITKYKLGNLIHLFQVAPSTMNGVGPLSFYIFHLFGCSLKSMIMTYILFQVTIV